MRERREGGGRVDRDPAGEAELASWLGARRANFPALFANQRPPDSSKARPEGVASSLTASWIAGATVIVPAAAAPGGMAMMFAPRLAMVPS